MRQSTIVTAYCKLSDAARAFAAYDDGRTGERAHVLSVRRAEFIALLLNNGVPTLSDADALAREAEAAGHRAARDAKLVAATAKLHMALPV